MSVDPNKMNQFRSGCSSITAALSMAGNLIDQIRLALSNSNQLQVMIQVSQPQNPSGQSPYKVVFRAVANRSISNYDWTTDPVAGIVDPPGEYATFNWVGSGPGQKTVSLTVTDFEGNIETATLNITLEQASSSVTDLYIPPPTTNQNAKYIFLPETVNFIPPAGNRYAYYATAGVSGDAGYSETPIFTGDGATPMPDGRFTIEIGHDFYDFQLLMIDEDNSENVIASKRYTINQNGEANLAYTGQRSDNPNISTYQATAPNRAPGTYYWDFFFREGDIGLFKNAGDNNNSTGAFGWDDTGNNQSGATVGFTGNLYIKAVLMSSQDNTVLGEATVIHEINNSNLPPIGESYPVSQDIGPGIQNIQMDRFDIPSAPAGDQTWDYIIHGEIMWTSNFDSTLYFAYQTDRMYEENSGYVDNRKGIEVPLDGQYHPFSSYPFSVKNRNVVVGFGGLNNAPSARLRNVRLVRVNY